MATRMGSTLEDRRAMQAVLVGLHLDVGVLLFLPLLKQRGPKLASKCSRNLPGYGIAYLTVQLEATVSYIPSVFGRCKP
jgi:hypothetical protein